LAVATAEHQAVATAVVIFGSLLILIGVLSDRIQGTIKASPSTGLEFTLLARVRSEGKRAGLSKEEVEEAEQDAIEQAAAEEPQPAKLPPRSRRRGASKETSDQPVWLTVADRVIRDMKTREARLVNAMDAWLGLEGYRVLGREVPIGNDRADIVAIKESQPAEYYVIECVATRNTAIDGSTVARVAALRDTLQRTTAPPTSEHGSQPDPRIFRAAIVADANSPNYILIALLAARQFGVELFVVDSFGIVHRVPLDVGPAQ
jgi:hypothetical protein